MSHAYKLLVFGASTSSKSINRRFARYAAEQIPDARMTFLDLNDFEMPIFSVDRERSGIPEQAKRFIQHIEDSDAIILSLAEHNGSYTAAFKNILDWTSRYEKGLWKGKPMFLLSTSNGSRGGKTVMEAAINYFPRLGAQIAAHFSLPGFRDHFTEEGITDPGLREAFFESFQDFNEALTSTNPAQHL